MEIELIEPSTELTVQDRAAAALSTTKTSLDLATLVLKSIEITVVNSKDGREQCHRAAMVLADTRIAISKISKAARDDATKFSKAVIAEEELLIAITKPEEIRLLALRDAWDKQVAAEKAAKELAEQQAVAAVRKKIADITSLPVYASDSSKDIDATANALIDMEITLEEFGDFAGEAMQAKSDALDSLIRMARDAALKEEQAAALAAQAKAQAEQAQQLAEERAAFQVEKDAFAAKQAAEEKAKLDAAAAIKAAEDKVRADAAAAEKAVADAARAKLDAEAAAERKRLDDIAAAERAEEQAFAEKGAADDKRVRDKAHYMLASLVAIVRLTDGSQPIDYPGALMVARLAVEQVNGVAV